MANKRLSMTVQKEILRLKSLGKSQRKTAKLLGISRDTVSKYWNGPPKLPDKAIPEWSKELDWNYVKKELKRSTRKVLYEELSDANNFPTYQAFCSYIKKHHNDIGEQEVTLRIERAPGASVEVDYSGDSIQILNPATGELYTVQLFVGSMSYSGKFYAEFTLSQKLEDFISSHNNMFTYFGGAASYIIPDNCKTAVTKVDRYDSIINKTYLDMCNHYNIVVDPADARSPRHKPNVENAVKYLQTDFLSRIRNKTFTSLIELNRELRAWLAAANDKEIQGRGQSRNFFFNKEKDLLKELPEIPYDLFYFKKAKVHPDCHIQYNKNYYSVPHQYVGKEIDLKYNGKMIHIYFNCDRIATHKVCRGSYHYSTNNDHYPESKFVEVNYHLALARKEAKLIGDDALLFVEKLINQSKYPLKILRKVQGVLRLSSKFDAKSLNYGCGMALEFNRLNYEHVRRFAKSYKLSKVTIEKAPTRQLELICLQGGICERNN